MTTNRLNILVLACIAFLGLSAVAHAQEEISRIAGLSAWYRADNIARAADGTLTALNDASQGGRHVAAGAKAPKLIERAINGRPALRFLGGESPLVVDGNDWSAAGFTVFAVASFDSIPQEPKNNGRNIPPGQALVSDGGRAGLTLGLNWNGRPGMTAGINEADPDLAKFWPYPNNQASDLVIAPKTFYALTYSSREGKRNPKANAWDCRLSVAVSANGTASLVVTSPYVSMHKSNGGKGLQFGAAGDRDRFQGDLAEVLVFNTELSDADRATVLAVLRAKYGLQAAVRNLPAEPVVIAPTLNGGTFWFRQGVTLEMSTPTANAEIRYTMDGTAPGPSSPRYSAPIELTAAATVKAQSFAPKRDPSPVTAAAFVKLPLAVPAGAKVTGGWKSSWSDEFDGPALDRTRWGNEIGYVRNSEKQYYTDRTENARIDNGTLLIQCLHDNWNGHEYTSASVSTENKVRLTYGRYEMRAKIDVRSGSWPAWWLWSRPDAAGWPKEGEIDMMEFHSRDGRQCLFNVVDGNGKFTTRTRRLATLGGDRWAKEYHVWTMDWTPDKIDLSLDGTLMNHFPVALADGTGPNGTNPYRNPGTKKMVLNEALGGSCGGAFQATDCPFDLRVDWVRVHTWSDEPARTLTVNGGVGSGPYVTGTKVSITALMPPAGYMFDKWEVSGSATTSDPMNPAITITMPDADVVFTATYRRLGAGAEDREPLCRR